MRERHSRGQKRRRKRWLAGLAAFLLLLAAGLLLFGDRLVGLLTAEPAVSYQAAFPGASSGQPALAQAEETANSLYETTSRLLLEGPFLVPWYQQAGRTGRPPAQRATSPEASDQLLLGAYWLEQGQHKAFVAWWQAYEAGFLQADGSFASRLDDPDKSGLQAEDWLRTNLTTARLLVQSMALWPDENRSRALQDLSDRLLQALDQQPLVDAHALVPTLAPVLDPGATPTPKPSLIPEPDDGRPLPAIRLASLDLYAVQLLIQVDTAWASWHQVFLDLVEDGFLGSQLPLYAWAWQPDQAAYLPFKSKPELDTAEAVLTVLHLCENGQRPDQSINWLRKQLLNQSALYVAYHPSQGTPTNNQESLPAYAMTARIARIIGDESLYRIALDRLLWHQATSPTSDVRHGLFRQEADDTVILWACDNLWALLALR